LVRKVKRLGDRRSISVSFRPERGKGSHGTLHFGERRATIPDLKKELKSGTLGAILRQLGLSHSELV